MQIEVRLYKKRAIKNTNKRCFLIMGSASEYEKQISFYCLMDRGFRQGVGCSKAHSRHPTALCAETIKNKTRRRFAPVNSLLTICIEICHGESGRVPDVTVKGVV